MEDEGAGSVLDSSFREKKENKTLLLEVLCNRSTDFWQMWLGWRRLNISQSFHCTVRLLGCVFEGEEHVQINRRFSQASLAQSVSVGAPHFLFLPLSLAPSLSPVLLIAVPVFSFESVFSAALPVWGGPHVEPSRAVVNPNPVSLSLYYFLLFSLSPWRWVGAVPAPCAYTESVE